MSSGPGRVERAIRAMPELERIIHYVIDHEWRRHGERVSLRFSSETVYAAAYGLGPWSRSQEVAALRAMRRIIAGQEGWHIESGERRRTVFCYERPAETLKQRARPRNGPERASVPVDDVLLRQAAAAAEQAASEPVWVLEDPAPGAVEPDAGVVDEVELSGPELPAEEPPARIEAEPERAASAPAEPERAAGESEQPSAPVEPDAGAAQASAEAAEPQAQTHGPTESPEPPALPVVSLPAAGLPKSAATVTVACKLPMGFWLRIQEVYFRRVAAPGGYMTEQAARDIGEPILIKGPGHAPNRMPRAPIEGGYALTHGVPADIWAKWLDQNRESAMVRNHMVFAHGDTSGMAREYRDMKSGLEPLHRDSSGELDDRRVPQPVDPLIGAVSTAKRTG
jgi:hypothetical protein